MNPPSAPHKRPTPRGFPQSASKKLRFSGDEDVKENLSPQFTKSLPISYKEKVPATPTTPHIPNFLSPSTTPASMPDTPSTPPCDMSFSECNNYSTPPLSPESASPPRTPPTPVISHSDDEEEPENDRYRFPPREDSGTGFQIKSNLKGRKYIQPLPVSAPPSIARGFAPLMRRRSSSLTSLINPFTPEGRAIKEAIQTHNPSYRKMLEEATIPKNWQMLANKPLASGSIYRLLFEELEVLGKGTFGEVTKCRHKVDGCVYAVKRTIRQLRGKRDRQLVLREVYGLAAILNHAHVVRYYNAWEEDSRIFMQAEWCEGGTLQSWVDACADATEAQLLTVLRHVALGLSHIHSLNLVHLDVKPENIYIKYTVPGDVTSKPIFKIGDLGLLNEANDSKLFMEGDCRYLSRELLQDDMSCLRKSDIFSLGASVYELCRRKQLPRNGAEWAEIRDGVLRIPPRYSPEFGNLLRSMVSSDPLARPSAEDIVRNPLVMMVANLPSVTVEGQEGCVCGRGQDIVKQLTQQVAFLQQQLQTIQAGLENNPSNPQTHRALSFTTGVQKGLQGMQL